MALNLLWALWRVVENYITKHFKKKHVLSTEATFCTSWKDKLTLEYCLLLTRGLTPGICVTSSWPWRLERWSCAAVFSKARLQMVPASSLSLLKLGFGPEAPTSGACPPILPSSSGKNKKCSYILCEDIIRGREVLRPLSCSLIEIQTHTSYLFALCDNRWLRKGSPSG